MRVIALYDVNRTYKKVAGIITTPYIYFDECVEACVKAHLEKVYDAWDIVYDRTTGIVHFTAGGAASYRSKFEVQVMQKDSVTSFHREPIRMSTSGEIIDDN